MRLIILFLILITPSSVFATEINPPSKIKDTKESSIKPISTTRYIAGGIIGTYPGFGLGHVIQGRWQSSGWIYTCGESISMAVLGYGALVYSTESIGEDEDSDDKKSNGWLIAGGVAFYCFKLAEIIDVWGFGYKYQQNNFIQPNINSSSIYIVPKINTDTLGLELCINF